MNKFQAGFTLIELVTVMLILGILGVVAAGAVATDTQDASDLTLIRNRNVIQDAIDQQYATTGSYPTVIDPQWFRGSRLPAHPERPANVPLFEVVAVAGTLDPAVKDLSTRSAGAYWYNSAEGLVKVRVVGGSPAEITARYNAVNDTNLTAGSSLNSSKNGVVGAGTQ